MKIAVLGSAGQIGKPLCEFLRAAGHEVVEIDLISGCEQDLRDKTSIFSNFDAPARWISLLGQVDFCYHLAFDVGGSTYLQKYQHSADFINNNLRIMENVFEVLHQHKVPYIFASSQMALDINSPYGVLKRLGEFMVEADPSHLGKVARFWNVFGPESNPEKFHVITDFVRSALKTGKIEMKTDGLERRQFLWAEDCCRGLEMIRTAPGRSYDLSSYEWTTIHQLARLIAERVVLFTGKNVEVIKGTNHSIQTVSSDPDETLKRLGFFPKTALADGVDQIIQYELTKL